MARVPIRQRVPICPRSSNFARLIKFLFFFLSFFLFPKHWLHLWRWIVTDMVRTKVRQKSKSKPQSERRGRRRSRKRQLCLKLEKRGPKQTPGRPARYSRKELSTPSCRVGCW